MLYCISYLLRQPWFQISTINHQNNTKWHCFGFCEIKYFLKTASFTKLCILHVWSWIRKKKSDHYFYRAYSTISIVNGSFPLLLYWHRYGCINENTWQTSVLETISSNQHPRIRNWLPNQLVIQILLIVMSFPFWVFYNYFHRWLAYLLLELEGGKKSNVN
jgi:hypothetical protein